MRLSNLKLKNFRNYHETKLEFSPNINVLIGENAQGKTNLLESIYVLAMTKSHRTTNDRELIEFSEKSAFLEGIVEKKTGNLRLSLSLSKKGKTARVNSLETPRLSQYIGKLNVILFSPEDLSLVKGSPAVRRRFIDMEFGQIDAVYLYELTRYRTILRDRNVYLKQLQTKQSTDRVYLEVLTEQLAKSGAKIILKRLEFLKELENYAKILHADITQQKENLTFKYKCTASIDDLEMNQGAIEIRLKETFETIVDKEIFQGTTLIGPHRDDVSFKVNGRNVQTYGSQGQQRTTALAVKLAEIDLMRAKTGEYRVLLLDDVLSELDGERQTHLLKAIQDKVQTFLTTPGLNDIARQLIKQPRLFRINAGKIEVKPETIVFYPKKEKES